MYCQDPSIVQEDDGDIEGSDSDDDEARERHYIDRDRFMYICGVMGLFEASDE